VRRFFLLAVLFAWTCAAETRAQTGRRSYFDPGLVVEPVTGGRLGACDALMFTPDGKFLLAAGDDKVVRVWEVSSRGLSLPRQPLTSALRWSTYREQRGAIYALALSPERSSRLAVVGGYGLRQGALAVLERSTGQVKYAYKGRTGNEHVTWSLAFAPSGRSVVAGKEDGSVWLWDLGSREPRLLGRHPGRNATNRVRLVSFLSATEVLSVAEDGLALRWDVTRRGVSTRLAAFQVGRIFRAKLSPDKKWLAAAGQQRGHNLEIRRLGGEEVKTITLPRLDLPHSLAFDPKGTRLAVGIRTVPEKAAFFKETGDRVGIYDLTADPPRPSPGPRPTFHAEALAFHPDGQRLAMAGGDDHEVTLWDLRRLARPVGEIRSPGSGLWSVGLSPDGRYLGYRTQRERDPSSPNRRGKGAWSRVFDLHKRVWVPAQDFRPTPPLETCDGWSVEPSKDAYVWNVRGPGGQFFALPLDRTRDGLPRCYTFLRPQGGHGVRLVVGHYWGASIFELGRGKPLAAARMLIGHQGEVTSLATTPKQDVLVTASRDQTIAAWSLADWPGQAELGARFSVRLGELRVEEVAAGSPAWEAGLAKGDDITLFAYAAREVKGGPEKWLEKLRRPVPGLECYFRVKRPGPAPAKTFDTLTTVRQRPLWRFFPTRQGEWVLWRWRDYYYASSAQGDANIGWQLSKDIDFTPLFATAAEYRGHFHNPTKVAEAIRNMRFPPERVNLGDLQPPEVKMEVDRREVTDSDLAVTLTVRPRGQLDFHQAERLALWIGDHRFWPPPGWRSKKGEFQQKVTIPKGRLRNGTNQLTFLCFSGAGTSSRVQQTVTRIGPRRKGKLFVVLVGIIDFTKARPLPRNTSSPFANLPGVGIDLVRLRDAWENQKGRVYGDVVIEELKDQAVTPAAVRAVLRKVARQAGPEDLLVLCLNGHGYSQGIESDDPGKFRKGTFTFVGPAFDIRRPKETGVTSEQLYEDLSAAPCRKLVLLNACYAGNVDRAANPLWGLAPDGVGPAVLSASDFNQEAWTTESEGGLFPQAVAEALDEKFAVADRSGDGVLDTLELAQYVCRRVPVLLAELKKQEDFPAKRRKDMQTPVFFPAEGALERFPVAGGKK
jgi:WD40 repeat protein